MKRLFWITVGAGAALYAERKARRFIASLTPRNLAVLAVRQARRRGELTAGRALAVAQDVRHHMAVREAQLTEAVEMDQAPPIDPRGRIPARILRARPIEIDQPDNDEHKDGTHGVG